MSKFEILEDAENNYQTAQIHKKKKTNDLPRDHVAEKKFVSENRGVLQPVNNGVRQDAKRVRLNKEVICINDRKKENTEKAPKLNQEILGIDKAEEQQVTPETQEKSTEGFPKGLLHVTEYKKHSLQKDLPTIVYKRGTYSQPKRMQIELYDKPCRRSFIVQPRDIWKYLHDLERAYLYPKSKYMLKQNDLGWNTRSILVDWLASVSAEYELCNETFHLSVNYIDRFLSHVAVVRNKFQLVGAAAMLLAGKMEEIYPVDVKEWSYLTGDSFTPRQILKMEQIVAKVLRFKMQPPTMSTFIEHFCTEHNIDAKTMNLAMYISELVLVEGDEYLNYLPSKLAAASIALARYTLSKENPWPKKFKEHSGYTLQQLSPVVQKQQQTFRDSPLKDQKAVQSKYKSEKYSKVALLKPRNLVLEDFQDET